MYVILYFHFPAYRMRIHNVWLYVIYTSISWINTNNTSVFSLLSLMHIFVFWGQKLARCELAAHTHCMCAASFWYYSKSGGELNNERHAYSWINTKFCTHLRRVHSGHYSDNLCQKLLGDEFPAEIWQITDTGFNWVWAHSQNFVLVLGMRISFNQKLKKAQVKSRQAGLLLRLPLGRVTKRHQGQLVVKNALKV